MFRFDLGLFRTWNLLGFSISFYGLYIDLFTWTLYIGWYEPLFEPTPIVYTEDPDVN